MRIPALTRRAFLALALCLAAGPARPVGKAPSLGRPTPAFTLKDTDGHPHTLASLRGRPAALFFFCGCPWCQRCGQEWGRPQRAGVLAPQTPPATVIVFSGSASEAKAFETAAGLDPSQTTLLCDPSLRVTLDLYQAEPCPRAFVLDGSGRLRYTNDHKEDAPRTAPASVIAARALTALRNSSSLSVVAPGA